MIAVKIIRKHAAYLEQSTVHLENISNITVDSDSVILHLKKNRSNKDCQEYRQEDCKISYNKNEANKSIEKTSETIEQNTSIFFNKTRAKQLNKTLARNSKLTLKIYSRKQN